MNERDLERLLRERGERLGQQSPLSPGAEARLRSELERDVFARRRRASRLRLLVGVLALAAAVVLLLTKPWQPTSYGRAHCELALLDADGRALESATRSTDPADFMRPELILVEVLAIEDAYLQVQLVDAFGASRAVGLGPEREQPLAAGEDLYVRIDLTELESRPTGDSEGSVLLFSSRLSIPPERIAALMPVRLTSTSGAARMTELRELVGELERELDCSIELHGFTLDRHAR